MNCLCGSNFDKNECCMPIISGTKAAKSPEQLMRSRYTAYAIKNASYLFNTYALKSQKSQSITEIKQWAEQTKWLKLIVIDASPYPTMDLVTSVDKLPIPTVTFSAHYILQNKIFTMTEKSNFIIENGEWRYLDGDFSSDHGVSLPGRNENCPCGSLKKFKRCCA